MSIATCLLFTGTTKTGIVPTFPGGVVLMNKRWSLFSKSFSLKPYARQSASESFSSQKVLQFDSVAFSVSGANLEHVVLLGPLVELGASSQYRDYGISCPGEPVGRSGG